MSSELQSTSLRTSNLLASLTVKDLPKSLDDGAKGWDRVKGEGFSLQVTTRPPMDTRPADA